MQAPPGCLFQPVIALPPMMAASKPSIRKLDYIQPRQALNTTSQQERQMQVSAQHFGHGQVMPMSAAHGKCLVR
jgi:hypothetical protein